jgi:hypothetical protein
VCTLDASVPEALVSPSGQMHRELARSLHGMLPMDHRVEIARVDPLVGEVFEVPGKGVLRWDLEGEELVAAGVSAMNRAQRKIYESMVAKVGRGEPVPAFCFAPGTDPAVVAAFETILGFNNKFQQTGRWTSTALSGGGLTQGTPTTITYSYAPDGTFVPDLIGTGSGNSQLFAWLNGIYGSPATWQALFTQVFARWDELAGLNYVFEANDDGSNLNTGAGVVGVRGDVRIAAIFIDGGSGILAYNNFPNDGDMVFDAFDSFYNSTTTNSLRLRNVISHEHGHGLGMLHVCPANQTKLMEPFVSTAYDGPQLDDILNAHRHYGDPRETNDTRATATALNNLGVGSFQTVSNVSIDDDADADFYRVVTTAPVGLSVTVAPAAATYDQGTQTSACNTGASTNYNAIHNLRFEVQDASGVVVGSVNATGTGATETGTVSLPTPGTYYVVVRGDATNNVQRYQLTVQGGPPPFVPFVITLPNGAPEVFEPGSGRTVAVVVDQVDDALIGAPSLVVDTGSGFQSVALVPQGGDNYLAVFPTLVCGDPVSYYFSATGSSGTTTLPEDAPADVFVAAIGEQGLAFADTFTANTGWQAGVAGDTATTGQWARGTPSPTDAQPAGGFDDAFCFATGLNGGNLGDFDIDGGTTTLLSPVIDLSGAAAASVSYARWYSNDTGAAPNADTFVVDVSSNNGTTWVNLETVGPSGPGTTAGWNEVTLDLGSKISLTNQVRIRFRASDLGSGSLVEAAVDQVRFDTFTCTDPVDCPFDLTGDGEVDSGDLSAFITAFLGNDLAADFTGDGQVDSGDLAAFITGFLAGCP